jgi:hypothetical protein
MELQKLSNFQEGEEFLSMKNGIAFNQRTSIEKANRIGHRSYTPIHSYRFMTSENSYFPHNDAQSVCRLVQSDVCVQRVIEPKTFKLANPRPPSNVHFMLAPPPLKVSTNLNTVYNKPRVSNISSRNIAAIKTVLRTILYTQI